METSLTIDETDTGESQTAGKYIYFFKEDLIKVTADAGQGWWYGHVVETFDEVQNDSVEQGFFPSTFVQTLKSMDYTDKLNTSSSNKLQDGKTI